MEEQDNTVAQESSDARSSSRPDGPISAGWARDGNTLYTLTDTGRWRLGEPILTNRFTVSVHWDPRYASDEEGNALAEQLLAYLQSAGQQAAPTSDSKHSEGGEG